MNNKVGSKSDYTPDYDSGFGFSTRIWGPLIWSSIHMMSFNYPVNPTMEDKKHYYDYIMSLQHVLPCRSCRENIKTNLATCKFNMDKMKNRETFSRFVYELHNCVNIMLGRKPYLTYEKVRDLYEQFRASCTPKLEPVATEIGCVVPLNNIKSRTIINIVPLTKKFESFVIDKRCLKKTSKKKSKKSSKKRSKKSR